jgi:hypothetical protein
VKQLTLEMPPAVSGSVVEPWQVVHRAGLFAYSAQWFWSQSAGCWPLAVSKRGALGLLPPHPANRRAKAAAEIMLMAVLARLIVFPFGA